MVNKRNQEIFGKQLSSPQHLSKFKVFGIKNLRNDRTLDWYKMNSYLDEFDFNKIPLEVFAYYA